MSSLPVPVSPRNSTVILLRRDARRRVEEVAHRRRLADHAATDRVLRDELAVSLAQRPRLERAVEREEHLVHVERFRDVLVRSRLDGADGESLRPVRGEQDHGQALVALVDDAQELHAVHLGHGEVRHHCVCAIEKLERLRSGTGEERLPAAALHELSQRSAHRGLVIDEQHTWHRGPPRESAASERRRWQVPGRA